MELEPQSEGDLYAMWERLALTGIGVQGTRGEQIRIVSRGERNTCAGPDYSGAVLLVDGELLAGDVEMHMNEQEWYAHGHQHDPAYGNVVLHVVHHGDGSRGPGIPTLRCDMLAAARAIDAAGSEDEPAGAMLSPAFIAELAWVRLLRRATQIVRAEPEYGAADRVRRAFLRRVFDALGYGVNRDAMGAVCEVLLVDETGLAAASFDEIATRVFDAAGLPPERVADAARDFMSESRLQRILYNRDLPRKSRAWRYGTRPANAPERRLWGGVRLIFDLYHRGLLERICGHMRNEAFRDARSALQVRMGRSMMVGASRAHEMLINAVFPAALASALLHGDAALVAGTCRLYRTAPSSGSNAILHAVERRFSLNHAISGAFWQQGAIEFHQRYLTPDRSRLSFVAESRRPGQRRS